MDPLTMSALIGGGSQLAGGIFGGMMGSAGQSATNAQSYAMFQQQMNFNRAEREAAQGFNHDEAQLNRDWQGNMSSTAYQRSMADMRAAGLNPILAANLGGASSPGGAQGSITGASAPGAPSLGNPGESLARGATSAGEAAKTAFATKALATQAAKDESQVDLNKASEGYTKSNTDLNAVLNTKAHQDTATSAAQQKVAEENARNLSADTNNKALQGIIYANEGTTAFHKSRQAQYEADQSGKWGPGVWGSLGGTLEKGATRFKEYIQSGEGARDYEQRRARRQNEPDPFPHGNPGDNPGTGLNIDMRRK